LHRSASAAVQQKFTVEIVLFGSSNALKPCLDKAIGR
jgi:hypothetical protein